MKHNEVERLQKGDLLYLVEEGVTWDGLTVRTVQVEHMTPQSVDLDFLSHKDGSVYRTQRVRKKAFGAYFTSPFVAVETRIADDERELDRLKAREALVRKNLAVARHLLTRLRSGDPSAPPNSDEEVP